MAGTKQTKMHQVEKLGETPMEKAARLAEEAVVVEAKRPAAPDDAPPIEHLEEDAVPVSSPAQARAVEEGFGGGPTPDADPVDTPLPTMGDPDEVAERMQRMLTENQQLRAAITEAKAATLQVEQERNAAIQECDRYYQIYGAPPAPDA